MTLSDLYSLIDQKIYANGQRAITGTILNDVLKKLLQFTNGGLITNAEELDNVQRLIDEFRFIENVDVENGYLKLTTDSEPRQVIAQISIEAILRGFDRNFPVNYKNALLGSQANAYLYINAGVEEDLQRDELVIGESEGIGSDLTIRIGDKEGSYYADLFNSDYTIHIELRSLENTQKYAVYELLGTAKIVIDDASCEYGLDLEHILGDTDFDYGLYSLKVIGFNKAGYFMNTEGIGVELI